MHKRENDTGVLTQIVVVKSKLHHPAECKMKVTVRALFIAARKTYRRTKDRLAAQQRKKQASARYATLNPRAFPLQAILAHKARRAKAFSAPPTEINARPRPGAWAQSSQRPSSLTRSVQALPTLKRDHLSNHISIARADSQCKERNPAAQQECKFRRPQNENNAQKEKGEPAIEPARLSILGMMR
jgi:hypothetical protein